jgi:hypothetical protein
MKKKNSKRMKTGNMKCEECKAREKKKEIKKIKILPWSDVAAPWFSHRSVRTMVVRASFWRPGSMEPGFRIQQNLTC